KIFLSSLLISISISALADPPIEEGKAIFNTRCASCHNINKTVLGPALAGVDDRRDLDWIIKFVQSSQTLIKSGDKDASALFAKFNNIPMPDHRDLSADKIKSVLEYIKSQGSSTANNTGLAISRPDKLRPLIVPIAATDYWVFGLLSICILLLILSIFFLIKVKEYQRKVALEK
ncbi:MAG: c-type cytochrome, partial [Flavisolibacter sp.]